MLAMHSDVSPSNSHGLFEKNEDKLNFSGGKNPTIPNFEQNELVFITQNSNIVLPNIIPNPIKPELRTRSVKSRPNVGQISAYYRTSNLPKILELISQGQNRISNCRTLENTEPNIF